MKKQITCILMALALMLGLLPVTALAIPESVPVTRAQSAEALYANESLKKLIDEAGEGQQTPDFSDIGPVQDGEDPCTDQQREAILALAKAGVSVNRTAPGSLPQPTTLRAARRPSFCGAPPAARAIQPP